MMGIGKMIKTDYSNAKNVNIQRLEKLTKTRQNKFNTYTIRMTRN
jgi:hypothetical protein